MNIKQYLWLLPFCSFLAGYSITHWFFSVKNIITPDIIGKNINEALSLLSEQKLSARIIQQKEDDTLPEGIIINQIPSAGKVIKSHQPLCIVTTKKPAVQQVPDCIGNTSNNALSFLQKKGIRTKQYTLSHPYPQGICFAQSPEITETLESNTLLLYISSGQKRSIIWPLFIGIPYELVIDFLQNHAIKPYIINDTLDNSSAKIVIDQRPIAGTILTLDEKNPLSVQLRIQ